MSRPPLTQDKTSSSSPVSSQNRSVDAPTLLSIVTERFGTQHLPSTRLVNFVSPILGFETEKSFVLLDDEEADSPFQWLQSTLTPALAFIVTNPVWFGLDYKFALPETVVDLLAIEQPETVQVFTLVTIPVEAPVKMTTNLMAPIVINAANQQAMQLVMHDAPPEFGIRVRLLPDSESPSSAATSTREG